MIAHRRYPVPGAVLLLATSCGSGEPCDPCALTDTNNFSYTADLALEVFETLSGADVVVDWSALTLDMRGGVLDPTEDIDEAWLLLFQNMDPDDLMVELAQDTIGQDDVSFYVSCEPAVASCPLSEMTFLGNDFSEQGGVPSFVTEERGGSWLIMLYAGDDRLVQSMAIVQPRDSSSAMEVLVTDDSSHLSTDVDLGSLAPVEVPSSPNVTVDWSGITEDGLGNSISVHTLDRLLIGHYSLDLADIELRFLEIEDVADQTWEMDVNGTDTADLGSLDGFDGVTDEGTWLLALMCTSCENPAPRFLTRLTPEGS